MYLYQLILSHARIILHFKGGKTPRRQGGKGTDDQKAAKSQFKSSQEPIAKSQ
jgi:hypothetical protein